MPDELDTRPADPSSSLSSGHGTMPGDTEEEDMPIHHTRMIRDMNDVAVVFLP